MNGTTRTILATVMMVFLLCTAEVTAQWEHFGLAGRQVRSLDYYIFNPSYPPALVACTDTGVYSIRVDMPPSVWHILGLPGKPASCFAAPTPRFLLAGLDSGTNLIWRSSDYGLNWNTYVNGFGGTDPSTVTSIEASPNIDGNYKYILACGGGDLGKSVDQGITYSPAFGEWGFLGAFNFVRMDSLHTNIVYVGGMSGLWGPLLMKTTDTCRNWTLLLEGYGAPANPAYDLVIHPYSADTVWIVLENCIAKSVDGGSHWTNFCASPTFHFRAIEVDQRNPKFLYASGGYNPGPLTMFYSRDGGTTWSSTSDTVLLDGPVTDIVLTARDDATNRIFFATERGVFRYTETTPYCCVGERGNVDYKGVVDLGDLTKLVGYLVAGSPLLCLDEANINGTGIIDLADLSSLVSYLTGGGFVLPPCPQ